MSFLLFSGSLCVIKAEGLLGDPEHMLETEEKLLCEVWSICVCVSWKTEAQPALWGARHSAGPRPQAWGAAKRAQCVFVCLQGGYGVGGWGGG